MTKSNLEKETHISFNAAESHAVIWTANPVTLRQLQKYHLEPVRQDGDGKQYHVPRSWISIRPKKQMNLSPERRAEIGARFAKGRAAGVDKAS